MSESIGTRIKHAWSLLVNKDPTKYSPEYYNDGYSTAYRPDGVQSTGITDKTIIGTLYNRLALDVASLQILHVRTNENSQYAETIKSSLNYALNDEANIDQTGMAFIQHVMMQMFEDGAVAIMPTRATANPIQTGGFEVQELRAGVVKHWAPNSVDIRIYNDITGNHHDYWVPKKTCAIVQNPLYEVMNEPNSTLQRLIRKLQLLDSVDEATGSGKLDIIIQLPYVIRSQSRRDEADKRIKSIEAQLAGSKYGVAYTDGTEKVIQLNRPAENNLLKQVEYLTSMLYSQLGLTTKVFDGTADETEMLNYFSRTINPLISAVVKEMSRKFLTKTARSQNQALMYFRDIFALAPLDKLSKSLDALSRNEIVSPNDGRAILGMKPNADPEADIPRNRNLNDASDDGSSKGVVNEED